MAQEPLIVHTAIVVPLARRNDDLARRNDEETLITAHPAASELPPREGDLSHSIQARSIPRSLPRSTLDRKSVV